MDKLFKQDILDISVAVNGETDKYTVKISFGGFLEILHDELKRTDNVLDLRTIVRALVQGINRDNVYIRCDCSDAKYRFNYWQTRKDIIVGDPETRPSNITNPEDKLGSSCKHVLLVLNNTSWLLKVASVINNYIKYMQQHYLSMYAKIIYPAIYNKEYEEPAQLSLFDTDDLDTDKDTLDRANDYGKKSTQFQKGNTQGVRFAPEKKAQTRLNIDDEPSDIFKT